MTESPTDITDADEAVHRREQIYPTLSPDQVDEARPFGQPQRFAAGDVLWEIGERALAFYIV